MTIRRERGKRRLRIQCRKTIEISTVERNNSLRVTRMAEAPAIAAQAVPMPIVAHADGRKDRFAARGS
jgi:hypothetical protein